MPSGRERNAISQSVTYFASVSGFEQYYYTTRLRSNEKTPWQYYYHSILWTVRWLRIAVVGNIVIFDGVWRRDAFGRCFVARYTVHKTLWRKQNNVIIAFISYLFIEYTRRRRSRLNCTNIMLVLNPYT